MTVKELYDCLSSVEALIVEEMMLRANIQGDLISVEQELAKEGMDEEMIGKLLSGYHEYLKD